MHGGCRAGQIVNFVHLDIKAQRNIVAHHFEARIRQQVLDILAPTGIVIIDAKHLAAFGQ